MSPEDALQPAPSNERPRGLHFVAINANIERQFEFVQDAWMMRTKFDGLTEESDPLLGNRASVKGCSFYQYLLASAGKRGLPPDY